jgi:uncharacterized membrane protein YfcA
VATPVLASVFAPREALGLTLPLLFATDLMALMLYRGQWDRRHVATLLPGTLVGIALAAPLLQMLSPAALARVIGVLALVSVLAPMLRRSPTPPAPLPEGEGGVGLNVRFSPFPRREGGRGGRSILRADIRVTGFLAALVAGFTSTLAHLGGLLIALYLLPQRLSNAAFVATASVVYCAMNAAKVVPYVGAGLITRGTLIQDLWVLPSLAAGVGLGFLLNRRLSGDSFSRIVRVVAVVTSLKLLWQGA